MEKESMVNAESNNRKDWGNVNELQNELVATQEQPLAAGYRERQGYHSRPMVQNQQESNFNLPSNKWAEEESYDRPMVQNQWKSDFNSQSNKLAEKESHNRPMVQNQWKNMQPNYDSGRRVENQQGRTQDNTKWYGENSYNRYNVSKLLICGINKINALIMQLCIDSIR